MYPKPEKRIRDPELMARLHLEYLGEPCEICELRVGTQLHHKVLRGRTGGDDTRENLQWVCGFCHVEIHS